MKIWIALFTVFVSLTSLFAQNTPATKGDILRMEERIDKKFETLIHQMDKRFEQNDKRLDMMQKNTDNRFEDMRDMMFYGFSIIAAVLSFLFIQNLIMIKSIGKLELSIVKTNLTQEKHMTPEPLPKVQKATEQDFESEIDLVSLWKKSDKHSKQKFIQELQQLMKLEI